MPRYKHIQFLILTLTPALTAFVAGASALLPHPAAAQDEAAAARALVPDMAGEPLRSSPAARTMSLGRSASPSAWSTWRRDRSRMPRPICFSSRWPTIRAR